MLLGSLLRYVRAVGQDVSLGKCVLLGTSKSVRKGCEAFGHFWGWLLLEGPDGCAGSWSERLDFTDRARAGTLSCRVKSAIAGLATVGSLPLGFQVKLGLVRGKYIPVGLHAAEASLCVCIHRLVPSGQLLLGRFGLVKCHWLTLLRFLILLLILRLHIIWVRFRMMCRYLAYCPDEEPRILSMLDLI